MLLHLKSTAAQVVGAWLYVDEVLLGSRGVRYAVESIEERLTVLGICASASAQ